MAESFLPEKAFQRLDGTAFGKSLARSLFWSFAGAVISRGLGVLASILVAQILGTQQFGELSIIQSTVNLFGAFAGFGLGVTATKYVAEFRLKDPSKAGRIIAFSSLVAIGSGAIMAGLLVMLSPWLATKTIAAPHLAGSLRIAALLLFLGAVTGAQTGALAGFEAFKVIAQVNFAAGVFAFPCLVVGAHVAGVEGAVWGLVLSLAASWFLNHLALRVEGQRIQVPLRLAGCMQERSVLWSFSLPALLGGAMVGPVMWLCNAMLVNQPHGYTEMGVFNAANQWRAVVFFLPSSIGAIVLPVLSNLQGNDNRARYLKVLKINLLLNAGLSLVIAGIIAILAKYIMHLYGTDFEAGYWVLITLAGSAVLVSMNDVVGQAIASKGRMWVGFTFNCLWAVALLTTAYLLVPRYQGLGLAWAILLAYSFHSLWQGVYAFRLLQPEVSTRDV